jgi:hypothetical protein
MKFYVFTIAAFLSAIGIAVPVNMAGGCCLSISVVNQTNIYSTESALTARTPIDADEFYCKPDRLEAAGTDGIQARQC